jgi:hypothetical protein
LTNDRTFAIIIKLSARQGVETLKRGQRANLEIDTEETSTGSSGLAQRAGRQERGSEIETVRIL